MTVWRSGFASSGFSGFRHLDIRVVGFLLFFCVFVCLLHVCVAARVFILKRGGGATAAARISCFLRSLLRHLCGDDRHQKQQRQIGKQATGRQRNIHQGRADACVQ